MTKDYFFTLQYLFGIPPVWHCRIAILAKLPSQVCQLGFNWFFKVTSLHAHNRTLLYAHLHLHQASCSRNFPTFRTVHHGLAQMHRKKRNSLRVRAVLPTGPFKFKSWNFQFQTSRTVSHVFNAQQYRAVHQVKQIPLLTTTFCSEYYHQHSRPLFIEITRKLAQPVWLTPPPSITQIHILPQFLQGFWTPFARAPNHIKRNRLHTTIFNFKTFLNISVQPVQISPHPYQSCTTPRRHARCHCPSCVS